VKHHLSFALAAVGVLTATERAEAAGFATARFGGEHGSVVTTNPTAVYYNPAGIGFSDGAHLMLDGQIALRHVTYGRRSMPSDPTDPAMNAGNTGVASLLNVFGAPGLGGSVKFGNLAIGGGFFVPFGGIEHWDKNDAATGLAVEGVQRWHAIDSSIKGIYLIAALAYRIGPISLGVSGNAILTDVAFTRAQTSSGAINSTQDQEGRSSVALSGVHGSFGAGVMAEVVPHVLWVGASYQAQPGLGRQVLNGTLDLTFPSATLPQQKVTFTQALPDIMRAGVRARPWEGMELRLFGDFTRWSVMKSQCLAYEGHACQVLPDGSDADPAGVVAANFRRNWNDTFSLHAGASRFFSPELEVFLGAGFETAATPDATLEPAIADATSIQGAIGARYFLGHWVHVGASYTHLAYLVRNNIGKSTLANALYPTMQLDASGKYTQWIGILGLNLEKTF
jgi:long-chain fatty acid transport protein